MAKELYPGLFNPTKCHYFIRLLHEKGLLLRNFTQNIDTLEAVAGIPDDKLVYAHGSFSGAHCVDCKASADIRTVKETILAGDLPRCASCTFGLVKPDIVFFGEGLPRRFFDMSSQDFDQCDLLLTMGTSLTVQPFAGLITKVGRSVPRVLINREKVAQVDPRLAALNIGGGFNFSETSVRDVAVLGDLQGNIAKFAELLGWSDDLAKLEEEGQKIFEEERKKNQALAATASSSSESAAAPQASPSSSSLSTTPSPASAPVSASSAPVAASTPAAAAPASNPGLESPKPNL